MELNINKCSFHSDVNVPKPATSLQIRGIRVIRGKTRSKSSPERGEKPRIGLDRSEHYYVSDFKNTEFLPSLQFCVFRG